MTDHSMTQSMVSETALQVWVCPDVKNILYGNFGLGPVPICKLNCEVYRVPTHQLEGLTKMEILAWDDQNLA